tara:strand:- start:139 stop:396 length:258 start_codon:yes stop_codon:yes gene_type:complete
MEDSSGVDTQLNRIEEKLDLLLNKFNILEPECKKMGSHIDFIEGVYDNVKSPMNLLCNKINSYVGRGEHIELPDPSCANVFTIGN